MHTAACSLHAEVQYQAQEDPRSNHCRCGETRIAMLSKAQCRSRTFFSFFSSSVCSFSTGNHTVSSLGHLGETYQPFVFHYNDTCNFQSIPPHLFGKFVRDIRPVSRNEGNVLHGFLAWSRLHTLGHLFLLSFSFCRFFCYLFLLLSFCCFLFVGFLSWYSAQAPLLLPKPEYACFPRPISTWLSSAQPLPCLPQNRGPMASSRLWLSAVVFFFRFCASACSMFLLSSSHYWSVHSCCFASTPVVVLSFFAALFASFGPDVSVLPVNCCRPRIANAIGFCQCLDSLEKSPVFPKVGIPSAFAFCFLLFAFGSPAISMPLLPFQYKVRPDSPKEVATQHSLCSQCLPST